MIPEYQRPKTGKAPRKFGWEEVEVQFQLSPTRLESVKERILLPSDPTMRKRYLRAFSEQIIKDVLGELLDVDTGIRLEDCAIVHKEAKIK